MATPVFPDNILTKIRAGKQANRFRATLGLVYQFRAFCCNINSASVMGVSKQPVVSLDLTPNPVCLGDAVTFDMSGSYAPGSTIVQYAIDMGDYTSYNVASGSHTYAAAGTYTVTATVTEGLGKYQTVTAQVVVIDCDVPTLISFCYTSLYGDGCWFIDFKAASPAWEERNTGLEGLALNVNSLVMRPGMLRLPDVVHELLAATDGGVFQTYNGGRNWEQFYLPDPSNAEFSDVPPATVSELIFYTALYDPVDPNTFYVLAHKVATDRLWVYKTTDLGMNWTSRGILAT